MASNTKAGLDINLSGDSSSLNKSLDQSTIEFLKFRAACVNAKSTLGEFQKTAKSVGDTKFSDGIKDFAKVSLEVFGGGLLLGGVKGIADAFKSFAKSAIDAGDATMKASERLGISIQQAQKYEVITKLLDTDIQSMTSALKKQNTVVQEAFEKTGKQREALEKLNLNYRELHAMNPDMAFEKIGRALAGVTNKTERAALAQQVWGKGASNLSALINNGVAGYDKMQKAIEGVSMTSEESVRTLADMDEALKLLKMQATEAGKDFVAAMGPEVIAVIDDLAKTIKQLKESGALKAWGESAGRAIRETYEAIKMLVNFIKENKGTLELLAGIWVAGKMGTTALPIARAVAGAVGMGVAETAGATAAGQAAGNAIGPRAASAAASAETQAAARAAVGAETGAATAATKGIVGAETAALAKTAGAMTAGQIAGGALAAAGGVAGVVAMAKNVLAGAGAGNGDVIRRRGDEPETNARARMERSMSDAKEELFDAKTSRQKKEARKGFARAKEGLAELENMESRSSSGLGRSGLDKTRYAGDALRTQEAIDKAMGKSGLAYNALHGKLAESINSFGKLNTAVTAASLAVGGYWLGGKISEWTGLDQPGAVAGTETRNPEEQKADVAAYAASLTPEARAKQLETVAAGHLASQAAGRQERVAREFDDKRAAPKMDLPEGMAYEEMTPEFISGKQAEAKAYSDDVAKAVDIVEKSGMSPDDIKGVKDKLQEKKKATDAALKILTDEYERLSANQWDAFQKELKRINDDVEKRTTAEKVSGKNSEFLTQDSGTVFQQAQTLGKGNAVEGLRILNDRRVAENDMMDKKLDAETKLADLVEKQASTEKRIGDDRLDIEKKITDQRNFQIYWDKESLKFAKERVALNMAEAARERGKKKEEGLFGAPVKDIMEELGKTPAQRRKAKRKEEEQAREDEKIKGKLEFMDRTGINRLTKHEKGRLAEVAKADAIAAKPGGWVKERVVKKPGFMNQGAWVPPEIGEELKWREPHAKKETPKEKKARNAREAIEERRLQDEAKAKKIEDDKKFRVDQIADEDRKAKNLKDDARRKEDNAAALAAANKPINENTAALAKLTAAILGDKEKDKDGKVMKIKN